MSHLEIFEKQKILFVSGNTWDVAGAKAFGMKVGWVNRTGQPSFDDNLRDLRPDYEFSNLGEIVELFGEEGRTQESGIAVTFAEPRKKKRGERGLPLLNK